jgi:hypothetical protein
MGQALARAYPLMPQPETGKIGCVRRSPLRPVVTRPATCNALLEHWFEAIECGDEE